MTTAAERDELDSGQHQAAAGPARRERPAAAAATHGGDVGEASAAAHASVGQLVARLVVAQVREACRFESCPAHSSGGTSRRQATAAVSKTVGPHGRASSILAPSARCQLREGDVGAVRRPVANRIVVTAMTFDSSTFRWFHQALSVQWSGRPPVERETTGSSPVRSAQRDESPWSSGSGRPVLIREAAGSNPAGDTQHPGC